MDISIDRLIGLIKNAIEPTISIHREFSKQITSYNYDNNASIKQTEIDSFLLTIPYFHRTFTYYLLNEGKIGNMHTSPWVSDEWLYNYNKKIHLWANSNDWLYGPLVYIHQPEISIRIKMRKQLIQLPALIQFINVDHPCFLNHASDQSPAHSTCYELKKLSASSSFAPH